MSKHTPGPWEQAKAFEQEITTTNGRHIATLWNNNQIDPSEALANGSLIAAAPDLLASLREVRERLRERTSNGINGYEYEALIRADQAIAKAEGASAH